MKWFNDETYVEDINKFISSGEYETALAGWNKAKNRNLPTNEISDAVRKEILKWFKIEDHEHVRELIGGALKFNRLDPTLLLCDTAIGLGDEEPFNAMFAAHKIYEIRSKSEENPNIVERKFDFEIRELVTLQAGEAEKKAHALYSNSNGFILPDNYQIDTDINDSGEEKKHQRKSKIKIRETMLVSLFIYYQT